MSAQNMQIARRFTAAFAAGDAAALEEIVAEDVVDHNLPPGGKQGRQGLLDAVAEYHAAFPDMSATIDHLVAEGEFVTQAGMVTGTNAGRMMGAPATGKTATFPYMDMFRVQKGRITETWHVEDVAGMLAQLGITGE